MMSRPAIPRRLYAGALLSCLLLLPHLAAAHCGTMAGPVVQAAQRALGAVDVTPVLKWVQPEDEKEVRAAFEQTMAVRTLGPEARELDISTRPWCESTALVKGLAIPD